MLEVLLQSGLLLLGALVTAFTTWKVAKRKGEQDRDAAEVDARSEETRMLLESIPELRKQMREVQEQLAELRTVNHRLELENLGLKHQLHTKDETIHGFSKWVGLITDWNESGRPDPPGMPPFTWQMKSAIQRVEAAADKAEEDPP